jgi:N-terminal domain of anti-restriction factor ArdC
MPRGEYLPHDGEQPQADRVKDALQTLEAGIDAILDSESFAAYLRTMARLPHYSFGNLVLIHTQHPTPTMVAGYRRWQELGRPVKKGERGIKILVPYKRKITQDEDSVDDAGDRVVVRGFGLGTVFDVSQTEGDPLPEPPRAEVIDGASDLGMRLFADLWDYLETNGISVSREHTEPANGYFQPATNHVGIGYHIDSDQATKTLTHETAHVVAGHTLGMESRDVETVAESAAYVVLARYGLDSASYSFPYIARWAQDRTILKRNLDTVQHVSSAIVFDIEGGGSGEKNLLAGYSCVPSGSYR